jgi:hypothetical protein
MCFKRKAYNLYSVLTIFKPPESFDLYIVLTKGLWLGAWKNRKDNYKFGIDFVECIKIVGFKIGNNVTQDDIWHPIYVKFENVLIPFSVVKIPVLSSAKTEILH